MQKCILYICVTHNKSLQFIGLNNNISTFMSINQNTPTGWQYLENSADHCPVDCSHLAWFQIYAVQKHEVWSSSKMQIKQTQPPTNQALFTREQKYI